VHEIHDRGGSLARAAANRQLLRPRAIGRIWFFTHVFLIGSSPLVNDARFLNRAQLCRRADRRPPYCRKRAGARMTRRGGAPPEPGIEEGLALKALS
jgi:hypothetical protein